MSQTVSLDWKKFYDWSLIFSKMQILNKKKKITVRVKIYVVKKNLCLNWKIKPILVFGYTGLVKKQFKQDFKNSKSTYSIIYENAL